jgi:hypothetical protein
MDIFKRRSKTAKASLSPPANAQFISNPHSFTKDPMEDSDTLISRTTAHSATVPGQASPYQDSDRGQTMPSRSNSGESVGYTDLLPPLIDEEFTDCRVGASSSQDRGQTPTVRPTGRCASQMQSPTKQPHERGPRIRPSTRSDNTILFARRFTATILSNSWRSSPFSIATTIMDDVHVRRSLTTAFAYSHN